MVGAAFVDRSTCDGLSSRAKRQSDHCRLPSYVSGLLSAGGCKHDANTIKASSSFRHWGIVVSSLLALCATRVVLAATSVECGVIIRSEMSNTTF